MLSFGLLDILETIFVNGNDNVRKIIIWIASNIYGTGDIKCLEGIMKHNLLIHILKNTRNYE
jgi:hypothetical protein